MNQIVFKRSVEIEKKWWVSIKKIEYSFTSFGINKIDIINNEHFKSFQIENESYYFKKINILIEILEIEIYNANNNLIGKIHIDNYFGCNNYIFIYNDKVKMYYYFKRKQKTKNQIIYELNNINSSIYYYFNLNNNINKFNLFTNNKEIDGMINFQKNDKLIACLGLIFFENKY